MSAGLSTEDELLVLRSREGDASALDALLRRWQEPLWRHALRLTGEEEAAWDVLQESLLVIARGIRRLEAESAFGVWAYRIVGHKSRDWLRRHIRRRERESRYAEQRQIETADAEEPLPHAADLKSLLIRLGDGERTLLMLRFENDFSIDEIARMLGIPTGTVKSRLHAAKQHLRTLMEK
jgi:RNA polymerase sigma factor (sigma-70 family)